MYPFAILKPGSVEEAVKMLRADPEAQLLAGGQSLLPILKHRLTRASALIDLGRVASLRHIVSRDGAIVIGAMARHSEVASADVVQKALPALAGLAGGIADPSVRNMGTIGGSLALNHPGADYPGALLGLGGIVHTDRRAIPADEFLQGLFTTALAADELIVEVEFPHVRRAGYCRFNDPASGYVLSGAFVAETGTGVRAAINGAGPCAFRLPEHETALGRRFAVTSLAGLPIKPDGLTEDQHGSAAYRAHLAAIAVERAVERASAEK